MKLFTYKNLYLSAVAIFILSACGGTSSTKQTSNSSSYDVAMNRITSYANNGGTPPTTTDYANARVNGVNNENIDNINEIVENLSAKDVDTTSEIQAIVDSQNTSGTTSTKTDTKQNNEQTITHHGLTYGTVISPTTKRVWLDRNIGATAICDGMYPGNETCYGDLYQWGRNPDGHEKINSKTTTKQGTTLTDSGSKFVVGHNDWTTSTNRTQNWAATDGRSVCPVNYRVPTLEEFKAEVVNDYKFLHLGYAYRRDNAGYLHDYHSDMAFSPIQIWTNTPATDGNTFFFYLEDYKKPDFITKLTDGDSHFTRASGHSVRCIQK